MNQLELLNVLDVIKNEEVYTKRLTEIKDAEQKLKDTRYVNETMESVNKLRETAQTFLENSHEEIRAEKAKLKQQEVQEKERIEKLEKKVKEERVSAETALAEAKTHVASVRELKKEVDMQQTKLGDRTKWQHEVDAKLKAREALLKSKMERINDIMKEQI